MEEHPIYGFARHYNPSLSDAEIKAKFIDGGKYMETLDRMRQETYPDLDQESFLTKFHSKYEDLSKKKEPTVSVASTSAGIKDATYSWDAPNPKLVSGVASVGPMTTQTSSGAGVAMEESKRASQELALKKARERGSFDRPAQLSETQKAQVEASVFEDKEYKTKFSVLSDDTNTLQKAIEATEARIKEKWGENWMQDYNARVEAINNPETQNREELIKKQQEFEADQYVNDRNNFITALEANQEAGKELLYSDKYERARALEKIDQERQKKAETQGWGNSLLGIAQRAASKFVGSAGHLMNIGENILTEDKKYTTWDAVEDFLIDFQSETEKVAPRPTKYTRPLFTKTATTTLNGQKVQVDYDGDKPAIIRDSKGAVIRPVSESDNFNLKPKNQWNGKGLIYQTGEVLADVLVQAATTKGIGGTLVKTGMGAKTAYQVGVTASVMGQMAGPLYNEGLKMFDGDKKKASIYAATAGLAIGVSSNLFGLESKLAGGKGGFLDNMTVQQAAKSLNPKTAAIQRAKSILKEGLGEAFEETILEQGIQSATAMMLNGDPDDIDLNEMKGTAVISFAVGALLGGSVDNSMWLVAAENPDEFRKALQAEKDAGKNVDVEKMYNKALKIRGLSEIKDVTEEDVDALDKVSELKDKSEKAKAIGLDEQAKVFKEEAANLEKEVLKEKEVEGENVNVAYETSKLEGAKVNIDGEIGVVEKTDSGYVLNTGEELLPIEDKEVEAQLIERGAQPEERITEEQILREQATEIPEKQQSIEAKTIEQLGKENKSTYPKIPTEKVFKNEVSQPSDRFSVDQAIESGQELPIESVSINDIIPTQKNLTISNLEATKDIESPDESIILVKENGKYYVKDGHHRIANAILNGDIEIEAQVFSNSDDIAKKMDDLVRGIYDKYTGNEASEKIKELFESKEYQDLQNQLNAENPLGPSTSDFKSTLSEDEANEYEEFEELRTKSASMDVNNKYKPYLLTSSEKKRYKELAEKFYPMYKKYAADKIEYNKLLSIKAKSDRLSASTKSETLPIINSLPPGVNGFITDKFFGFIMNSKAMDWIKKVFVNTFYAGGNLPKDVAALNYRRIAKIQGMMKQAEITSNKLKELIKGKSKQQVIELNDALQTGSDTYADGTPIEPEVLLILGDMRKHIDSLSGALISSGIATGKLEAVIANNLETYLTRSYEVHFNKDWIKKVKDTAAYTRARAYLENKFAQEEADAQQKIVEYEGKRENNPEFWDRKIEKQKRKIGRDIDAELEAMLMKQSKDLRMADVAKSGSLGSMNLGVFKKRKGIPEEIRDLFGEVKDPLVNYMTSVFKIVHILENNKFLAEVEKQGLDKFLFDRPTGNHTVALPDTAQMGDLAGYYTTPEIAEAFRTYNKPIGEFDENSDLPTQLYGGLMKVSALSKSFMTVFSIGSGFRNLFSNPFLMLQKGGLNPGSKHVKKAIETFRNKDEKEIVELYSRGVMGEGITFAELADIRKQYQKEMRGVPKDAKEKFLAGWDKVKNTMSAFYAFGDDFFRVIDYYRNQDKMAVLNYGKKFKNLTPDEQENVKQLSADRVSSESPTYSRLPRNIKALRRNPVVAPFPSFPYEMVRVSYNIFANLINDMKNGQDMTVKVGGVEMSYKNLMFAKTMIGAATVSIVPFIIKDIAKIALGWDDDDEESLKYFVPFYHEGSILIPHTSEKGNVSYLDLGYMMPQGHILSTFAAFNDTRYSVAENTLRASEKFFEPFYSLDPLMKASIEAVSGSMLGKTGRPISVVGEQGWLLDRFYHVQNKMTPGTIKSFQRVIKSFNEPETDYYGKLDPLSEGVAIFPGYRSHNIDIHRQFGFVSQNIAKKIDDTRLDYKIQVEKESTKAMTPDDRKEYLDKIRNREIKDYNKFVTDLHKIYIAAVDFPEVDKRKIDQALETVKLDPVTRNNVKNGKLDLPKFLRQ